MNHGFDARTWQLWGKADPARDMAPTWHPLLCHLLDVVACAERLLTHVRVDRLAALSSGIGLPRDAALPWLRFFVGLHDVGKATPGFQRKAGRRVEVLRTMGLDLPNHDRDQPHGGLSTSLATAALVDHGVPLPLARTVARSVGAHHGEFVRLDTLTARLERRKGELLSAFAGKAPLWTLLRNSMNEALASSCGLDAGSPRPRVPASSVARNILMADLAGLTTVADWLGSNVDAFPYVEPPASPADYLGVARERAIEALGAAGWRPPPQSPPRSFHALFGKKPWPLHEGVEQVRQTLGGPSLVIIEAPMGEGKTEAALAMFDGIAAPGATGLYFALPTQATSNQIFDRVERFIREAFPDETHGLHLVHGDAGLSERYEALRERARALAIRSVDGVAGADAGPVADAWFARGKRALLAPLGVGTIDQALLGVLGVRHGFVRLHGLAGKVVVVDEVHAYDTYTSTLVDRLLSWLHVLGTTVVLLSATLPARRRAELVATFAAAPPEPTPYPRITVAGAGGAMSRSFAARRAPMSIAIRWEDPATLPDRLAETLAGGGCVAWIVNTVRLAQRAYLDIVARRDRGLLPANIEVSLLHARFPFEARAARERAAAEAFGPGEENRPRAAILVGTQVLEQSLDLDFDLMLTELAPVDLVLQRAGRLHRHSRKERPALLMRPALWLVRPEGDERPEGPSFGPSARVYAESILLRSWLALRDRTELTLPTDIEPLIERAYGGADRLPAAPMSARLASLDAEFEERRRAEDQQARSIVLAVPGDDDPFDGLARVMDDEDPRIHLALRAATRLADPAIDVVFVTEQHGRTVLALTPEVALDLDAREAPSRSVVRAGARQAVGITDRRVVRALLREPVPPTFEASGHLRFHRVLRLDASGSTTVAGVRLTLHADLGLVVGPLDGFEDARPPMETCP